MKLIEALFVKDARRHISKICLNFLKGGIFLPCDVLGIYLVDFGNNRGGEFSGKHYALILTTLSKDKTVLAAPITSKKSGKKYKGGFTIDCYKYQSNPSCAKAYIQINKIREIDKTRILSKRYDLDSADAIVLEQSFKKVFTFLK